MSKHARLSASQTKQWATCPGSSAYLEANPHLEGGSGHYAQLGTCAHALVERCLREGSEPSGYLGRLIKVIEDEDGDEGTSILPANARLPKDPSAAVFEVDADMADAVACMTDYVRRRCVELGLCGGPEDGDDPACGVAELVERGTVRLEGRSVPLPGRDDTGGTSDVVIDCWPDLLEVVDYKNGSGVFVSVRGNEQLRSYGLGELLKAGAADYRRVRYTICQPRHMQSPDDGVMSEEVDAAELLEWGNWLSGRADRVDDARAAVAAGADLDDLNAGGFLSTGADGSHCTFCPLLSRCPAALATAQEGAGLDFDDDPRPVEEGVPGANRLAAVLPWVPFLDKWLRALEADAEGLLLRGGSLPGFKLVHGRSNRRWVTQKNVWHEDTDVVEVVDFTEEDIVRSLVDDFGLTLDQVYTAPEPRLITGPQAEKLVKKDDRKRFNDALLDKPEGKLTIAPEDDVRPGVTVDPGADFDGLED